MFFSFTFFYQLILQDGIFGMAASLIFFTWFIIKWHSAAASISTNIFFVIGMTLNCINAILKHFCRHRT